MDQSTFNHGKSGDTNPKGRSRSPLLELYTRSLRNEREEKIGHRTSAACGGRLRLCYTLDEGKESERETTNCPPKRVRSNFNPTGQYLRRKFLDINVELISKSLLRELSSTNLEIHAPKDDAALRVSRRLDADLNTSARMTFLIGRSGNGKSVACHKKLTGRVKAGGFALVLTHEHIAKAATLPDAVGAALHEQRSALTASTM